MSVLAEHLAATRQTFIERTGKQPRTLALGRWDVRELIVFIAQEIDWRGSGSELLAEAREGEALAWGAVIRVDGRVGRMPGAMWWHE